MRTRKERNVIRRQFNEYFCHEGAGILTIRENGWNTFDIVVCRGLDPLSIREGKRARTITTLRGYKVEKTRTDALPFPELIELLRKELPFLQSFTSQAQYAPEIKHHVIGYCVCE